MCKRLHVCDFNQGGMNILTNSDVYAGLSQGHFLSPTGGCKTWDEKADGYCRSGMSLSGIQVNYLLTSLNRWSRKCGFKET